MLSCNSELIARTKPFGQSCPVLRADEEHHVLRVPTQAAQDCYCLRTRSRADGICRHHCPIIVQKNGPTLCPLIRRHNMLDRQFSEIWIQCHDPKPEPKPDTPAPPPHVVPTSPIEILEETAGPVRHIMCAHVSVMLLVSKLLL